MLLRSLQRLRLILSLRTPDPEFPRNIPKKYQTTKNKQKWGNALQQPIYTNPVKNLPIDVDQDLSNQMRRILAAPVLVLDPNLAGVSRCVCCLNELGFLQKGSQSIGSGPNTASESRVSNTDLSEFFQHQPKGNNYKSNGHPMQHLYSTNVVALLSGEVEMVL